jgi:hypothetical protein
MFDIFFAALLIYAIFVSLRRRSWRGLLASVPAFLLWGTLAAAGWYGRGAETMGFTGAWFLVVLGPSAVPGATGRVPFSGYLGAYPSAARVALAVVLGVGFAAASYHTGQVSPLSDEAARRKEVALALLVPTLLITVQMMCVALANASPSPY